MGGDEPERPDGIGVTTLVRTGTVVAYDPDADLDFRTRPVTSILTSSWLASKLPSSTPTRG